MKPYKKYFCDSKPQKHVDVPSLKDELKPWCDSLSIHIIFQE